MLHNEMIDGPVGETCLGRAVTSGRRLGALLLSGVLGMAACSSQFQKSDTLPSGYFSVQSVLAASGFVQRGGVSRGRLGSGKTRRFPLKLSGGCVTVVAFGGAGVQDLSLLLKDSKGKIVAGERQIGPDSVVRYCPDKPGNYQATLTMKSGAGAYTLSVWNGGASDGASRSLGGANGPIEGGDM